MRDLPDELLIEAYLTAKDLDLSPNFILMLEKELKHRRFNPEDITAI